MDEIFPPYKSAHGPGEDPFEAVMCTVGAASQISYCLRRILFLNATYYLQSTQDFLITKRQISNEVHKHLDKYLKAKNGRAVVQFCDAFRYYLETPKLSRQPTCYDDKDKTHLIQDRLLSLLRYL